MTSTAVAVVLSTNIVRSARPHVRSRCDLTAWDLLQLSDCYAQQETTVFVDCNDAGAQFVVAACHGISVADLTADGDVPGAVRSFFPLTGALNHDGHSLPLLAVQITELNDGMFIGCSFNHSIVDGESLWHFINCWSELSRGSRQISRPPLMDRAFLSKEPIRFIPSEEAIRVNKWPAHGLSSRVFRFSQKAMASLKAKANQQCKLEKGEISSLQALSTLIWRAVTRARKAAPGQMTICLMVVGNRQRWDPPMSPESFGNYVTAAYTRAPAGEQLSRDLGSAARALHETVSRLTSEGARAFVEAWVEKPFLLSLEPNPYLILVAGLTKVRGSWGRPAGVLWGPAAKFDGQVLALQGCEGAGSVDLEVCLSTETMVTLHLVDTADSQSPCRPGAGDKRKGAAGAPLFWQNPDRLPAIVGELLLAGSLPTIACSSSSCLQLFLTPACSPVPSSCRSHDRALLIKAGLNSVSPVPLLSRLQDNEDDSSSKVLWSSRAAAVMAMEASVEQVSTTTAHLPRKVDSPTGLELTAWDLAMLSTHYMQICIVFPKPPMPLDDTIHRLQTSLSNSLLHIPFLSGRLATDPETTTYVDRNDTGVEFTVSKAAGLCISDLVSDVVPETINSFFPLVGAIGYDDHYRPLLAVQVVDGVVIGCSMNHVIGDGGSFWHFVESWSELSAVTRPPVTKRPPIHKEVGRIWFTASEKNMDRTLTPPFKVRMLRFTSKAVARVKAKANQQLKHPESGEVSSLQAITALMWRSMMRAKNLPTELITLCIMNVGCCSRLEPPLPEEYFGNYVQPLMVHAKVGELLGHDLGWAGRALRRGIAAQTADAVRNRVKGWVKMPYMYGNSRPVPNIIVVGGSPRED
ncbi:putative acetyltransferase [Nymphaea thermarum]|nr:putative acetyltransferase [Nymphaea thermarum]